MDRIIAHWIERTNYDLETAKVMLDNGRYLYVTYMCQQAVEKLLILPDSVVTVYNPSLMQKQVNS